MSGASFGFDASSAYGAMGYMSGMTKTINTNGYISAVLKYAHARLAEAFDLWMDALARTQPRSFQHVYEWPTHFQDYHETVGVPNFRLWKHTLSGGNSRNQTASFAFKASVRPSPVDPILLQPGPDGEVVKQNVHIFSMKATVMEYGLHVEVTPKLAHFLAYVGRDGQHGQDAGWHHARENEDGSAINFSKGPVTFNAGGNITKGKFTEAFVSWWTSQAGPTFDHDILPKLEGDLNDQTGLDAAIRMGKKVKPKTGSLAFAGNGEQAFAEGQRLAEARLAAKQANYINQAAARRRLIYGD